MENKEAIQTVHEIRKMMEHSSKFLSFSGLSIILIGIYGVVGAYAAKQILMSIKSTFIEYSAPNWLLIVPKLIFLALIVFTLALATLLIFAAQKSKKQHRSLFNAVTYRTFLNFFVPLVTGGIFCFALLLNGYIGIIAPAMLLFYGLSLVNVAKYTYGNIFWLGVSELILGLLCSFFPARGLLFWSLGFGLMHIMYGIYFYFCIERKENNQSSK